VPGARNALCVTNGDFYTYAYSNADGNTYDQPQRHTNGHSNRDTYCHSYRHGPANAHRQARSNTKATSHTSTASRQASTRIIG